MARMWWLCGVCKLLCCSCGWRLQRLHVWFLQLCVGVRAACPANLL
jgi:hypothetical protein